VTREGATLVDRALAHLKQGPVHTLALARDVLGLHGPAGPSSAAVFALLRDDPRVDVDAGGTWALKEAPVGPLIDQLSFAVVDVETTGGRAGNGDRITDIAIVQIAGGQIVDEFASLVNPGRSIPPMIRQLTGITDQMVAGAPRFEHIAPLVSERLVDRVFVAHNVAFDRRFVSHELLDALGDASLGPSLCTVQLSRALLPQLERRNLDAVARFFDVPIRDRHRALGDAVATAHVLLHLLDEALQRGIRDLDTLQKFSGRRGRRRNPKPKSSPDDS